MARDIREHVQLVKDRRLEMVELARGLRRAGVIVGYDHQLRSVCGMVPFFALFLHDLSAETHIRFRLMDWQTDSDVVITNIGTVPSSAQRKGFASQAVQEVIAWAKEKDLHEIRATQVSDPAYEKFWEKNGFVRDAEPNDCGDYVYRW